MAKTKKEREIQPARKALCALIVEDNPRDVKLTAATLEQGGFSLKHASVDSPERFQKELKETDYEVIISDYNLRSWTAMDALKILKDSGKDIPFIVVTGSLGDEAAAECIKLGATDYILKDRMARLPLAVEQALSDKKSCDERRRVEAENIRLRAAIEQAAEAVLITDPAGAIQYVNPAFTWMTGYTSGEALNQNPRLLKSGKTNDDVYANLWRTIQSGKTWQGEIVNRRKDGTTYPEWMTITPVLDSGGGIVHYIAIKQDVTERKKAECEIANLNRVYAVISQINQMIVRTRDADQILAEACRIAVEYGKFRMAWIGKVDWKDGTIKPVAMAGIDEGYLQAGKSVVIADRPEGRGPSGTAIREGKTVLCNDVAQSPKMAPWRDEALKRGYGSVIALPITIQKKPFGALTIYAAETSFFNEKEVKLLEEIAADISFALEVLETERERQRAEAELRESEDRYRDLVENSQDLICTHDLSGHILTVNKAAANILGHSPDELRKFFSLQQILVPEFRDQFDDYVAAIQENGRADGQMVVQTKSGEKRIWEYHNTLRTEGVAQPIVRGLAQDKTEFKHAEKALRESQRRLELIAEASKTGFWDWDLRTNQAYFSPEWMSQIGYTADEIPAHFEEWKKRVHPEDLDRAMARIRKFLENPQGYFDNEFRLLHKDGSYRWILARASVLKDAQGCPYRMMGSHLDITDIKRVEEMLQEYERVVEASQDMIAVVDRDYRFLIVNRAFLEYGGIARDQVIGHKIPEVLEQEVFENVVKPKFDECLEGRLVRFEMKYKYPRLGERELFVSYFPIEGPAGIDRVACVLEDVTERKQLEQQFRHSQKMEAIGQLAGGVAHDFNNILTVINGYSELVLGQIPPENPLRNQLNEVKKAGERAAGLTRQLLAFSRQQVLAPQVLDLNQVVANVQAMLKRLIGEDIDLVTTPAEGLGQVKADPGQIEQVLLNLAVNARDAMPKGGRLSIKTANAQLGVAASQGLESVVPGYYVLLSVGDSGTGIDAETRKRIFEPFFTTKEKGKGTGLGLSTVYGIVKQSGGHIEVESELGRGTTFKIYLPRVEMTVVAKAPEKQNTELPLGTETILLVEDEPSVRLLVRTTLEAHGYDMLESTHGIEAMMIAQKHPGKIHLLLTDLVMPGMSGRMLAEQIALLHPEARFIFMSGYTDDAVVQHGGLGAGMAFLQKPFTPHALARKVRETLDAIAA
jgi:PAS domain S-box-containing protein